MKEILMRVLILGEKYSDVRVELVRCKQINRELEDKILALRHEMEEQRMKLLSKRQTQPDLSDCEYCGNKMVWAKVPHEPNRMMWLCKECAIRTGKNQ